MSPSAAQIQEEATCKTNTTTREVEAAVGVAEGPTTTVGGGMAAHVASISIKQPPLCLSSTTWRHRKHPGYFNGLMIPTGLCRMLTTPTITPCRMCKIDIRGINPEVEGIHP